MTEIVTEPGKPVVYVIHLDEPIAGQSSHYIGCTADLEQRIEEHRRTRWEPYAEPIEVNGKKISGRTVGPGSTFLGVANHLGIGWRVVQVLEGGFELERQIKKQHHHSRYCPVCNGKCKES